MMTLKMKVNEDYAIVANNLENVNIKKKITLSGNIAKKSFKTKTVRRKKNFYLSDFQKIKQKPRKKFLSEEKMKNIDFYFPSYSVNYYQANGDITSNRYFTEYYPRTSINKMQNLKRLHRWVNSTLESNAETYKCLEDLPQLWFESRLNAINYRVLYSRSILNIINDYENEKVQQKGEENSSLPNTVKRIGVNFYNQKLKPAFHRAYMTRYSTSEARRLGFLMLRPSQYSLLQLRKFAFGNPVSETDYDDKSDANGSGNYWNEETYFDEFWMGHEKPAAMIEKGIVSEGGPNLKMARSNRMIENRIRNVSTSDDFENLGPTIPEYKKKIGKYSAWNPASFWYDGSWKNDLGPTMAEIYKFKKTQGFFSFSFIPKFRAFVPISNKWKNSRIMRSRVTRDVIIAVYDQWLSEFGIGPNSIFSEDIGRTSLTSLEMKCDDAAGYSARYSGLVFPSVRSTSRHMFGNLNYLVNKQVYRSLLERSKSYKNSNHRLESISNILETPIERFIFGCRNYRDAQLIPMESIIRAELNRPPASREEKIYRTKKSVSPWYKLEFLLREKITILIKKLEKKYDIDLISSNSLRGKFHSISQDIIPIPPHQLDSHLKTEDEIANRYRPAMCCQKTTVILIPEFFGMRNPKKFPKTMYGIDSDFPEGYIYDMKVKTKKVKVKIKITE